MKGKLRRSKNCVALAAILIFIMVISLSGCDEEKVAHTETGTCRVNSYEMDLKLDVESKTLSGIVVMNLTNETEKPLKKLCIRNYSASILKNVGKGKSYITEAENTSTKEKYTLKNARDPSVVYVKLGDNALMPEESISLKTSFYTDIPEVKERFGYTADGEKQIFQLSFCFPQLAMYENGKWNENPYIVAGECTHNKVTDYHIRLDVPDDYLVVASGDEATEKNRITIDAENMRDMSIVASNNMKVKTEEVCGVKINNYSLDYTNTEDYYNFSMASAKDSVELFTELFGEYPYDELDVVSSFIMGGMEYPGLLMIGLPDLETPENIENIASYTEHCSVVAHEVAHQWFYATVGNDQYREPWLDESLASYCQHVLYTRSSRPSLLDAVKSDQKRLDLELFDETISDEAFDKYCASRTEQCTGDEFIIDRGYNDFDDEMLCLVQAYEVGRDFLYELRKTMGDDNFFRAMRNYYKDYCLKEAHTEDFLNEVRTVDNSEEVETVLNKYFEEA